MADVETESASVQRINVLLREARELIHNNGHAEVLSDIDTLMEVAELEARRCLADMGQRPFQCSVGS